MSSTVTTATVSTVTAAITLEGLGQVLLLVSMLLLAGVLLAKEVMIVSNTRTGKALTRGLDLGIMPLLAVFGTMLLLNGLSYFLG